MSDMKKYEFTGEVKNWFGNTLHRIRAVVAFGDVSVGDLGGWVEKEENLSHDDNAWALRASAAEAISPPSSVQKI